MLEAAPDTCLSLFARLNIQRALPFSVALPGVTSVLFGALLLSRTRWDFICSGDGELISGNLSSIRGTCLYLSSAGFVFCC